MDKPRFQVTLANMLRATFWMAICFAGWGLMVRSEKEQWDMNSLPVPIQMVCGLSIGYCALGGPFIAIGALFGRTRIGAAVALPGTVVMYVFLFS
jgi:hypothetical protein